METSKIKRKETKTHTHTYFYIIFLNQYEVINLMYSVTQKICDSHCAIALITAYVNEDGSFISNFLVRWSEFVSNCTKNVKNTCWLTFSSSITANCVKLWSRTPDLELRAADGCRLLGRSNSGVAGDSTTLPPCWGDGATLKRPNVATPDWLLRKGAGFWLASDVDLADAACSLSNLSGACSKWLVALRRVAANKRTR